MVPRSVKASLGLFLACAISAGATETVWSAFALIHTGERIPLLGPDSTGYPSLTSLGAQQLYSQGSVFRARYLPNTNSSSEFGSVTTSAPIVGIQSPAIDNRQLFMQASTDDDATGSALAFMQGLYPPAIGVMASSDGVTNASMLVEGSLVNYPLGGYQYPNIQSLSLSEPDSVWLQGYAVCTEYQKATLDLRSDPFIDQTYNDSYAHYQELWSTVFAGTFNMSMANFGYAYDLYEYASFQYTHNETISQNLPADEMNWLAEFASIQQFAKNGDLSISGKQKGDEIRAISGRTLAYKVVSQFQEHINSEGAFAKLSLMFGSYEPFLAFFALSRMSNGHDSALFRTIPQPGAAMVFELFSVSSNISTFPVIDDLWVRLLYRNSTVEDAPLSEYPLFGLGNSETRLKYTDFVSSIHEFSVNDLPTWCNSCGSVAFFCQAFDQNSGHEPDSAAGSSTAGVSLSPALAGVIGAITAIAVIFLATVTAAVFGGIRIYRNDAGRKSSLGGFKGAEKMASDNDLSVAKNGARHERVGSWELGGPGAPPGMGAPKTETTFGATRMREADDDGDSIMGRAPVKPRESI
ncbi:histidine phosphatase superfamily [Xylariales sp. AK1849]|nr:histidine phosphatase superfamily [Xylariales sp. AK1849]